MSDAKTIADTAARLNIRPEAVQTYLDAGLGRRAPGVERRFHTTIKPIGSTCNLQCTYCYYLSKGELLGRKGSHTIEDATLEQFISEYIAAQDAEEIVFTWHGGEPTLLGLPFFRKVVGLQEKHRPSHRHISNDIQTNGMLLDDEWCAFLARQGFLVGLSIDGPRELHDVYRRTGDGGSSFEKAFAAALLLKKHGIPFSTLSTINRENGRHPIEVYGFLRNEVGTRHMQFIPCVEPLEFEKAPPGQAPHRQVTAEDLRARPGQPDSVVTDFTVEATDWGDFLIGVFDEWSKHDRSNIKVNLFENIFAQQRGAPALVCSNAPICGKNLALESDGSVYCCDHFVYPEHRLGRLGDLPLAAMVFSLKQLEFGLSKFNTLPSECRTCSYIKLCWGDCPRTRILKTRAGDSPLSYLCPGWKKFFRAYFNRFAGGRR
jgi:uncharacterized protein